MSRWKAGAIHFAGSLAVFLILLTVILFVWYPGILFSIDGGWTGLQIVIGVDLVLGPLLTLVVFKAGKPGLKFDLSCIVLAQAVCMAAGMWIVYQERPIALVLAFDTFYSLSEQEFEDYGKNVEVLGNIPGRFPKLIYVELPENDVRANIANLRSQFIGDPLYMQTENYMALQGAEDLELIFRQESAVRETANDELLASLEADCQFLKFLSTKNTGFVCYEPGKGVITSFYDFPYLEDI